MATAEELSAQLREAQAQLDAAQVQMRVVVEENRALRDQEVRQAHVMAEAIGASLKETGLGTGSKKKSNVRMPIFSKGQEDYNLFATKFEAWRLLHGIDGEEAKLSLFSSFEGQAAAIARIFGPGTDVFKKSYTEYATAIRNLFSSRAESEAAKSQFEARVQGDESAQIYAAHKSSLFMVAYPDCKDTAHLIREYIRGLSDTRVREQVVLHSGKTFPEVVDKARDAEAAFQYLETLKKATTPVNSGAPPRVIHQPQPQPQPEPMDLSSLTAMMAAMQGMTRDRFGRFIKPTQEGCWNCGQHGHLKRQCTNPPAANSGRGGWNQGRGRGRGGRGGRGNGRGGRQGNRTFGAMEEGTTTGASGQEKTGSIDPTEEEGNPANQDF